MPAKMSAKLMFTTLPAPPGGAAACVSRQASDKQWMSVSDWRRRDATQAAAAQEVHTRQHAEASGTRLTGLDGDPAVHAELAVLHSHKRTHSTTSWMLAPHATVATRTAQQLKRNRRRATDDATHEDKPHAEPQAEAAVLNPYQRAGEGEAAGVGELDRPGVGGRAAGRRGSLFIIHTETDEHRNVAR